MLAQSREMLLRHFFVPLPIVHRMSTDSLPSGGGTVESRWSIDEVSTSAGLFRHAALTVLTLVAAATYVDPTPVAFRFENQLVEPAMLLDKQEPALENFARLRARNNVCRLTGQVLTVPNSTDHLVQLAASVTR